MIETVMLTSTWFVRCTARKAANTVAFPAAADAAVTTTLFVISIRRRYSYTSFVDALTRRVESAVLPFRSVDRHIRCQGRTCTGDIIQV